MISNYAMHHIHEILNKIDFEKEIDIYLVSNLLKDNICDDLDKAEIEIIHKIVSTIISYPEFRLFGYAINKILDERFRSCTTGTHTIDIVIKLNKLPSNSLRFEIIDICDLLGFKISLEMQTINELRQPVMILTYKFKN